tara:strand:+ start:1421 stop:1903 length:483 start_codon:yes stop_codon:yes gene_type:complete
MGVSTDKYWMHQALVQAKMAFKSGEVPIGAIVVDASNNVVGKGYNRVIANKDPTAHAEICAIKNACTAIDNYRLHDCTLYTTLEPCVMCAGAIVHARVKRVVFSARDIKAGAAGSAFNIVGGELNHIARIDEGVLERESSDLLNAFFEICRARKEQSHPA